MSVSASATLDAAVAACSSRLSPLSCGDNVPPDLSDKLDAYESPPAAAPFLRHFARGKPETTQKAGIAAIRRGDISVHTFSHLPKHAEVTGRTCTHLYKNI
jgi:hypothetical protein